MGEKVHILDGMKFSPTEYFYWLFGNFIQCTLITFEFHFSKFHLPTLCPHKKEKEYTTSNILVGASPRSQCLTP